MAKVITFSRTFPKGHPKVGQPTYFVEAFLNSTTTHPRHDKELERILDSFQIQDLNYPRIPIEIIREFIATFDKTIINLKHHTIRSGHRFKKGDLFSPRVWGTDINPKSGKSGPYHSKQIILAPDTEVLEVWDIEINEWTSVCVNGKFLSVHEDVQLANNDGLKVEDFFNWFSKMPFDGQIICWNETVKY